MKIFLFNLLFPSHAKRYIKAFLLLREIYDWTEHKNTRWALKTKELLDEYTEEA